MSDQGSGSAEAHVEAWEPCVFDHPRWPGPTRLATRWATSFSTVEAGCIRMGPASYPSALAACARASITAAAAFVCHTVIAYTQYLTTALFCSRMDVTRRMDGR